MKPTLPLLFITLLFSLGPGFTDPFAKDDQPLSSQGEETPSDDLLDDIDSPEKANRPTLEADKPVEEDRDQPQNEDIFVDPNQYEIEDAGQPRETDLGTLEPIPKTPPVTYIIKEGDTLWDICIRFFGDPYTWPRLWQVNNYIRNPHLIYPGNIVKFHPGEGDTAPMLEIFAKEQDADIMEARFQDNEEVDPEGLKFNKVYIGLDLKKEETDQFQNYEVKMRSFFSKEQPVDVGAISYSAKEGVILSSRDVVYISFYDPSTVSSGDIFTVYRIHKQVKDPDSFFFGNYGYQISLRGTLQVINTRGEFTTARITEASSEIQRGDRVTTYVNPYLKVRARQADFFNESRCLSTEDDRMLIGERDIVYIKGGTEQNVKVGDTYEVVFQGDTIMKRMSDLPTIVKGSLIVLKVYDEVSMALITETNRDIEIGDRLITSGVFTGRLKLYPQGK